IATVTPSGDPFVYDDVSDDEGLQDPNTEWGERFYTYVVRHISGEILSADSEPVGCWAGPAEPTGVSASAVSTNHYDVSWDPPPEHVATEVWDNWDDDTDSLGDWRLVLTTEPGASGARAVMVDDDYIGELDGPAAGQTISIRVRHKTSLFGVVDVSRFVTTTVELMN